ncbi:MAG: 4-hydroxy-3-methylbut-2-enyl diphosphate reductase [Chitinophagaceae bacterium]|nr:4-hydroxy-3-methylbut-2-enyl diphosphate reductase [Chitinophagaceae bacterium]
MNISIDTHSGYCFGVDYAIQLAEDELERVGLLYCLGDIVHNDVEIDRLHKKGLRIISHNDLENLQNATVLIRAHGEPPETYKIAMENNINLIDASCPVVLKLQNRLKNSYNQKKSPDSQIVIYGKENHAEIIGLTGQIHNDAIIISDKKDLERLNFSHPIILFSQTTKPTEKFYEIKEIIERKIVAIKGSITEDDFQFNDSICRQVSNREPQLKKFSTENDIIIFVAGKKSSNGKVLYDVCLSQNKRSYFIEKEQDIQQDWFQKEDNIGICGATSTPTWLMENVKAYIWNAIYPDL